MGHKYIRRVSLDQFYSLVTGQKDAFYNMCMVLPEVINKAVSELDSSTIPNDTVFNEIRDIAAEQNYDSEDLSIAMAFYLLGFSSYLGFE